MIVVASSRRGDMWWVESHRAYWRQGNGEKEEELMIN